MRTIYKYKLEAINQQTVLMPEGAQVLTVQMQNGDPHVWAAVDPDRPKKPRLFAIYGTGHPMVVSKADLYVGTVQMNEGALVFHIFTEPN